MRRTTSIALVTAVAVLAVAAFGTTASAAPRKQGTIVDTAIAAGEFTTLAKLLKRAGLVSTLRTPGPFTVFAPTDAAFAKVPKATLDALAKNKAKLKAVLLYHVVPGKVTAAKVVSLRSAKTAGGPTLRIRVTGKTVRINDARVVQADVKASNGVIHVVDSVLLPPAA